MTSFDKIKYELKNSIKFIADEIEKRIDGNKKTAAFVSYNQSYRNQVGNLHRKFKEAGFNVINIVGLTINDRFEREADTFIIPKVVHTPNGIISIDIDFEFIDIIISPDKEFITEGYFNRNFLSKRAKKIYLPHDALGGWPQDSFDYTILPSHKAIEKYKNNNFRKGFCLIPAGYPKLDYSIEKYNSIKDSNKLKENSIIYAPTKKSFVNEPNAYANLIAVGFDSIILDLLLKNFKENIIFRPHPHNINYHNLLKSHISTLTIKNKYEQNPKIIFNFEPEYLKYYLKSKCMVTDISDTAFNYAFTTLKPVLFFDPFNLKDNYSLIGEKAVCIKDFIRKIENILNNREYFENKILEFRNENINNVGLTGEYLLENLDYIFSDKKHPDWHYF